MSAASRTPETHPVARPGTNRSGGVRPVRARTVCPCSLDVSPPSPSACSSPWGIATPARTYNAPVPRWRNHDPLLETLPKSYDWSLREATKAMEPLRCPREIPAGQRVGRAQVVVGFGDTTRLRGLRLDRTVSEVRTSISCGGRLRVEDRANMGRLIAHEFGHVVGLDHARPGEVQTHGGGLAIGVVASPGGRGCTTADGLPGRHPVARSDSMAAGSACRALLPAGAEAPAVAGCPVQRRRHRRLSADGDLDRARRVRAS